MIDFDILAERDYCPTGDPRRCHRHPWVTTSSADGMFDAPCGHCEYENEKEDSIDEPAPVDLPLVSDPSDDNFPF